MAQFLVFEREEFNGTLQEVTLLLVALILLLKFADKWFKGFIFVMGQVDDSLLLVFLVVDVLDLLCEFVDLFL